MPCPLDERDETANLYTVVCLVVRLWVPPLSLGPLGSCYSSVKGFFDLFSVDHRCRLRSPRPRRGTLLLPRGRNRLLAAGGIETALFVHPSDDTLVHGQRAPTTEGRRQLGQRRRWPQIARLHDSLLLRACLAQSRAPKSSQHHRAGAKKRTTPITRTKYRARSNVGVVVLNKPCASS